MHFLISTSLSRDGALLAEQIREGHNKVQQEQKAPDLPLPSVIQHLPPALTPSFCGEILLSVPSNADKGQQAMVNCREEHQAMNQMVVREQK